MTSPDEEPKISDHPSGSAASVEEILRMQDELERWVDRPGTLPIHDALHELRRAIGEGSGSGAREAIFRLGQRLEEFPAHPTARSLRERFVLEPSIPISPPGDVASIRDGPLREDPMEALVENAARQVEIRHLLESRVAALSERVARLDQVVNMMGAALVILVALAVLGWTSAFGFFSIPGPSEGPGNPQDAPKSIAPADVTHEKERPK